MQEGFWFVRLDDDLLLGLNKIKEKILVFMRKLRSDLGKQVFLK